LLTWFYSHHLYLIIMSTHQSIPKPANAKKKSDILPIPAQSKSHPVVAQPKIESTRSNEEQLAQMRANREASERMGSTLLTPESVPRTLPPLQPKLTIGQPGDQYEQEADRVARQVVDHINAPPKIQAKTPRYPMSVAARKPSPLDDHPAQKVQRYATGGEMDASPDLESSIQRARGGGQPLGDGIRARMEGAFGADFSGVRVHTDGTSDQLNQSIQAKAFTTGQDVFFRKGAYNPGSRGGQELLAHELTHVVQQSGSGIHKLKTSEPNKSHIASPRQVMNKVQEKTIQLRAANAQELNATQTEHEGRIFDSAVHKGVIFTKQVQIPTNETNDAILGYIEAIRQIGKKVKDFHYIDKRINNWATQMPNAHNWNNNKMAALALVKADLEITDKGMKNLFSQKTWEEARQWLDLVHSQRDNLRKSWNTVLVDPFLLELTLTSARTGDNEWRITTQFADSAAGYITQVVVGNKDITGTMVTAGEFRMERRKWANTGNEYIYSSTHEQGDTTFEERVKSLKGHEDDDQLGTHSRGLDAITWLAAEGARFKPVAEMKGKAKPQTQFYIKPQAKGWRGAKYVTLTWLMQNWGTHFNKAYGVEAETIASVVQQHGQPLTAKPSGSSYNLTKKRIEQKR
jgi:hypothetical protein